MSIAIALYLVKATSERSAFLAASAKSAEISVIDQPRMRHDGLAKQDARPIRLRNSNRGSAQMNPDKLHRSLCPCVYLPFIAAKISSLLA